MDSYNYKTTSPKEPAYMNDDIPETITARNSADPSEPDSSDFGAVLPPGNIIPGEAPSPDDPADR